MSHFKIITTAFAALLFHTVQGVVRLPQFYTDNMVVQQQSQLVIPGYAHPYAKVRAWTDWGTKEVQTTAGSDGAFRLTLQTPDAGGPYTIIVSDGSGEDVVLSNVLSGEVWLCSGQSNMEFPVKGWAQVMSSEEIVATARHPEIRLLQIRKNRSFTPLSDAEVNMGGWVEASPSTMDFSAIAYLFALKMKEELGIPVGVIDATWGGTPAEAWTPADMFDGVSGFEEELAALAAYGNSPEAMYKNYNDKVAAWYKKATGVEAGFDKAVLQSGKGWGQMPVPGLWETSVLPDFDGIVWMQTSFTLPDDAAGKPLELYMGPIDNQDITYFNGVEVGSSGSWDAPRHYTVPAHLIKSGENVISIRITDFDGEGGIGGEPEKLYAETNGQRYPLAGNWTYRTIADFSKTPHPVSIESASYPSVLFNAMIAPLNVMPIRGVLWYQGCANVGRDEQYAPLFKSLINSWRKHWGTEFPFYFVQLAGYLKPLTVQPQSKWAALRNSQAKALELPNTGMAVAIDLGNPVDIHPVNKQEVARRLSLLALNRVYGKSCIDSAPRCSNAKQAGDKLVLTFDGKVCATSKIFTGFIVGDAKGNFAYAKVVQQSDDKLELSSPLIKKPTVARYNWADCPDGNLKGETGLPVAPFATDK